MTRLAGRALDEALAEVEDLRDLRIRRYFERACEAFTNMCEATASDYLSERVASHMAGKWAPEITVLTDVDAIIDVLHQSDLWYGIDDGDALVLLQLPTPLKAWWWKGQSDRDGWGELAVEDVPEDSKWGAIYREASPLLWGLHEEFERVNPAGCHPDAFYYAFRVRAEMTFKDVSPW